LLECPALRLPVTQPGTASPGMGSSVLTARCDRAY